MILQFRIADHGDFDGIWAVLMDGKAALGLLASINGRVLILRSKSCEMISKPVTPMCLRKTAK